MHIDQFKSTLTEQDMMILQMRYEGLLAEGDRREGWLQNTQRYRKAHRENRRVL